MIKEKERKKKEKKKEKKNGVLCNVCAKEGSRTKKEKERVITNPFHHDDDDDDSDADSDVDEKVETICLGSTAEGFL